MKPFAHLAAPCTEPVTTSRPATQALATLDRRERTLGRTAAALNAVSLASRYHPERLDAHLDALDARDEADAVVVAVLRSEIAKGAKS